jgi:hypothetical protein
MTKPIVTNGKRSLRWAWDMRRFRMSDGENSEPYTGGMIMPFQRQPSLLSGVKITKQL